ncbi:hypothetical protein [Microvirga sp. G4-2]|uniref:hypothetical protein n=1 Tax=Microvirga sp. G4-2 TaxID=3434467 RepID=UPI00404446AC
MTRLRLVLLLANGALIVCVSLLLQLPLPVIDLSAPKGEISQVSANQPAIRTIPALDLEQSLFRPTSSDPQINESQEALSAPEIRLAGVLLSDEVRLVLVEQQDLPLRRLQEGDDFNGWIVTSIEPRSMTLMAQGQTAVYRLDPSSDDTSSQSEIVEQPQDPM